jgi:hypothetical protein
MSGQAVVYELSLKDRLSQGLVQAEGHAHRLESSLHGVHHAAERIMEGIGLSMLMYKGVQFIEDSLHTFHELHEAEAQLENTLANVGERAHVSGEEMVEFAKKAEHNIPFTAQKIMEMEGAVARFNITSKDTFERVLNLSADIAAATKKDGVEIASSLGMIMEKPASAMRRLREFHIILSKQQQETIQHLVATGNTAKAQEIIFEQLRKRGYEGAAEAAAKADPLFKLKQAIVDIKRDVGEGLTTILHKLTPLFNTLAAAIQNTIGWMKQHKELMEIIGSVIGTVAGIILVIAAATKIWTVVQWALNSAILANPITWFVLLIAGAVVAVIQLWHKWAAFRAFLYAMWGTIKEFGAIVGDVFKGLYHVIMGVFHFSWSEVSGGWDQMTSAIYDSAKRMGEAYKKGWDEGMVDFNKEQAESKLVETPKPKTTKPITGNETGGVKDKSPKASNGKNVTINIKIGNMIDKFNVNTTNIREGYDKIKEHVTQVMLSAVNDSQVIAGE